MGGFIGDVVDSVAGFAGDAVDTVLRGTVDIVDDLGAGKIADAFGFDFDEFSNDAIDWQADQQSLVWSGIGGYLGGPQGAEIGAKLGSTFGEAVSRDNGGNNILSKTFSDDDLAFVNQMAGFAYGLGVPYAGGVRNVTADTLEGTDYLKDNSLSFAPRANVNKGVSENSGSGNWLNNLASFASSSGVGDSSFLNNLFSGGTQAFSAYQNNSAADKLSDELLGITEGAINEQRTQTQQGIDFQKEQLNKFLDLNQQASERGEAFLTDAQAQNLQQESQTLSDTQGFVNTGYDQSSNIFTGLTQGEDSPVAQLRPYSESGQQSLQNLTSLVNDPQAQADYIQNNPLYQSLADDAQSRVFGNMAARGKLGSGETAKSLQEELLSLGSNLIQRDVGNLSNLSQQGQLADNQISDIQQKQIGLLGQNALNRNNTLADLENQSSQRQQSQRNYTSKTLADLLQNRVGLEGAGRINSAANILNARRGLGNSIADIMGVQGDIIGNKLAGRVDPLNAFIAGTLGGNTGFNTAAANNNAGGSGSAFGGLNSLIGAGLDFFGSGTNDGFFNSGNTLFSAPTDNNFNSGLGDVFDFFSSGGGFDGFNTGGYAGGTSPTDNNFNIGLGTPSDFLGTATDESGFLGGLGDVLVNRNNNDSGFLGGVGDALSGVGDFFGGFF